jgi:CheY-like chemotaxis protein
VENERILVADDDKTYRRSLSMVIKVFGEEDSHKVVGEASSKEEVEAILKGGLRPSIALVDGKFPSYGDGEEAAAIIRKLSPETFIISLSSDLQTWGDENLVKNLSAKELVELITKLQH